MTMFAGLCDNYHETSCGDKCLPPACACFREENVYLRSRLPEADVIARLDADVTRLQSELAGRDGDVARLEADLAGKVNELSSAHAQLSATLEELKSTRRSLDDVSQQMNRSEVSGCDVTVLANAGSPLLFEYPLAHSIPQRYDCKTVFLFAIASRIAAPGCG